MGLLDGLTRRKFVRAECVLCGRTDDCELMGRDPAPVCGKCIEANSFSTGVFASQYASTKIADSESFPDIEELRGIRQALAQLVALKLYEIGVPLDHVYAADSSGLVEAGILALAAARLNDQQAERAQLDATAAADLAAKLKAAGVDPRSGSGGYIPGTEPSTWTTGDDQSDPMFYDGVRRLLLYLNQPFNDMDDLEQLAKDHDWTRENIGERLAEMGLE